MDPGTMALLGSLGGGGGGGGGGPNLATSHAANFTAGPIQTGATFNFAKPASATGFDLSGNVGWLLLAAIALGVGYAYVRKGRG